VEADTFNALDPLLDHIADFAEKQLDSLELCRLVAELGKLVGKKRVASVNIVVDVFDEKGMLLAAAEYRLVCLRRPRTVSNLGRLVAAAVCRGRRHQGRAA
jgi:hypothetical protein